jgi:FkbM family methyltransferase
MLRHLIYYKNLTKYFNFIDAFFITFCLKFRFSKLFLPILKRTILLRKNTKDKETFKEIFFSNIYNTELPFEPKKIIDAGSNIGLASFFFRIKYPKSKIVAFEIETENYNTSIKNLKGINEIEVFVGGVRMRKTALEVFDPTVALDSPEGDSTVAADFTFDANTNTITLLATPQENTRITVVKKVGQSWTESGKTLGDTQNSIARFLRAGTSELPE